MKNIKKSPGNPQNSPSPCLPPASFRETHPYTRLCQEKAWGGQRKGGNWQGLRQGAGRGERGDVWRVWAGNAGLFQKVAGTGWMILAFLKDMAVQG